jgi:predicted transcriptional regulator
LTKQAERPSGGKPEVRSGLRQLMGDLEAEIMECVWELGSASVKEVHRCLQERREIAYTTVMTVMSRLATKGLLTSRPEGRAYIYEAVADRETYCADAVRSFMSEMLADADKAVLSQFVDSVTEHDKSQLDMLAQIIEEKRLERSSSL